MKQLTQWILALAVIATVASFSGAWTSVQNPAQGKPAGQGQGQGQGQGKRGGANNKARAEKQAAIKKALPTLKTTLSEAIGLAEKETTGKAFSAGVEIVQGKAAIAVNLYVGEKLTLATIDPETKKVTVASEGKKEEGEENGEEGEGKGEGKGKEGG